MKSSVENKQTKHLFAKPPVVVVLGHIDHGKSSLLEAIKKEIKITAKEAGGITQHIGAYEVEVSNPPSSDRGRTTEGQRKITFIDTPGHEAFSAMRSRGAKVADIAVLVVDAAEGVRAQTKEAIIAAKEAGIPFVVALNKIDKPQAQPERTKQELQGAGVLVESLGGKTPAINTSAATGQGIEELLETILLVAEMEELKADIAAAAEGMIIESAKDSRKGPVATLLLAQGILKVGDIVGTASAVGRLKKLYNFQGIAIEKVLPGQACQAIGFAQVPEVGEKFRTFPDLAAAAKEIKKKTGKQTRGPSGREGKEEKKALKLILKADVLGSLEAIEQVLTALPQEQIALQILKKDAGDINVNDIYLAEASGAKIFGFRVKIAGLVKSLSRQRKIFPRTCQIIYELVDEVRKAMEQLLSPEIQRVALGKVKIIALFKKSKKGQIIGGRVIEGEVSKNSLAEVSREDEVIGNGRIKNIQQEKKDIAAAGKGKEIGMLFLGEPDIQEGDIIAFYKEEKQRKVL